MDAKEMSPGGSSVNDGISIPPAVKTGAFPTGGHSGSLESLDSALENAVKDLNALKVLKDIDPQGLLKALPALQYFQGRPASEQKVISEEDMIYFVTHEHGPISKLYKPEFWRLELELGLATREEGTEHVNTLQIMQNISAPGVRMNTATPELEIVPTPGNPLGVARPSALIEIPIQKLLVSALVPVRRQQERAAVEKVLEDVEVNLEHNLSEYSNEGSESSSDGSQQ